MPSPNPQFLQAGGPTNGVKLLKAKQSDKSGRTKSQHRQKTTSHSASSDIHTLQFSILTKATTSDRTEPAGWMFKTTSLDVCLVFTATTHIRPLSSEDSEDNNNLLAVVVLRIFTGERPYVFCSSKHTS